VDLPPSCPEEGLPYIKGSFFEITPRPPRFSAGRYGTGSLGAAIARRD